MWLTYFLPVTDFDEQFNTADRKNRTVNFVSYNALQYKLEKDAQGKCCPVRSIGLRA